MNTKWNRLSTRRGAVTILLIIVLVRFAPAGDSPDPFSKIDSADLKRHCHFLAADALEGRAAGSQGGQAAAAYLVTELRKLKLSPPPGMRDYRQPFGNQYANVIAVIPGRNPTLKDEWIVLGGHYDHVGYGTKDNSYGPVGKIHNGADDNASGCSLLLELASLFADPAVSVDRSLVIAFWDAEEVGLLGSKHWISHPTVPLNQVKLAFNLDMIGRLRNDHVAVMGWRSAGGLRRQIVDANGETPLRFGFETAVTSDSDHYSFYAAKRPVIHFDTGKHVDYHRPSDDVEKVNFEGLERLGRLVGRMVLRAANAPSLPEFRLDAANEPSLAKLDPAARMSPPVRFGVRWGTQRVTEEHYLDVADVIPNTPAAKVGLRKGDRLLKFDRWTGGSLDALRETIAVAPGEVDIQWQTAGETEPRSMRIQLAGEGVRVGLTYRLDPALPGCGLITTVMSYTPADRGGLQPGDVLLSVGEQEVPPFADFGAHLPVGPGPFALDFERLGQPKRIIIDLP